MATSHSRFSDFAAIVRSLEGASKGQTFQGLNQVKSYLQFYGYYGNTVSVDLTDDFDESLESALKVFQESYGLQTTGEMDSGTVNQMCTPRCGNQELDSETQYSVSPTPMMGHYSLGPTKWSKSNLTYCFNAGIPEERQEAIRKAFMTWTRNSAYDFAEVQQGTRTDIDINFSQGDHGDRDRFDGRWGTLAHAFYPEDGRLHFDAEEIWSTSENPAEDAVDLESVALHEIGHLLGLRHSSDRNAVMYESIELGKKKRILTQDDIDGIEARYQN